MSIAELVRAIKSKKRVQIEELKRKASFDYILADLMGRSIARIYSQTAQLPKISDVYPSLFVAEEIEEQMQEKRDELSAIRFKQFVNSHNKKFTEGGK